MVSFIDSGQRAGDIVNMAVARYAQAPVLLVGDIDQYHLNDLSRKTERYINRKIRSLVLSKDEYNNFLSELEKRPRVLIWETNTDVIL